jgi:nitrogen fixation/metabolism regulation signal transduction histidine kinase
MVFKRFRTVCALRVVLLAATLLAALAFARPATSRALAVLLAALSLGQVVSLIRFVERTNRDLTRFFESIRYEDYAQGFQDEGLGPSFAELRAALSDVAKRMQKTRAEKEEQAQYFQTVVQHVGVGLIVFQPDGTVELINGAAKRLLRVPWLKTIQSLEALSTELVDALVRLEPREKAFIRIEIEKETLVLALYATEFKLRGRELKLVSLQNIHRELEEKEMEAWQKLIRVITHEIMNSVTPISTLASTVKDLTADPAADCPASGSEEEEVRRDIRQAALTIEKRSQGLLHFVDAFRSLTLLPRPKPQAFLLRELMDRVGRLMKAHMDGRNIRFSIEVEPASLELDADPELVEQVLINLLLNALQAVEGGENPEIGMKGSLNERGRVLIQVLDNGPGIPAETIDKIFIPFFTTKKGGSGIGLSLSRQIMRLHHGMIHVHSAPGSPTVFTLTF